MSWSPRFERWGLPKHEFVSLGSQQIKGRNSSEETDEVYKPLPINFFFAQIEISYNMVGFGEKERVFNVPAYLLMIHTYILPSYY